MNWQILVGILFLIGGIGNIATDFIVFLFGLVVGAALIFWGLKKKGFQFQKKILGKRQLTDETIRAVGVTYYERNIQKLAYRNPGWDRSVETIIEDGDSERRIFQYNYKNKPVQLIIENNNPNDKNAVAVHIAGELVGYISKDENIHVRDILKNHEIKSLSAFIGGGKYKVVSDNHDINYDQLGFSVTIRIQYV